ncbi:MAG TPA: hypothetical protein VHC49_07410 [Mycobacteriales bacterium]|nr:hypothetical protein [Mycobacteriales bacterium]
MSIRSRLQRLLSRKPTESDVEPDPALARRRATGGGRHQAGDAPSTTGTGPSGTFVGRASADDPGPVGESGAEKRAGER